VTTSGVGLVIGAGIYVLVGSAAAEAGNALWVSFILAAGMSGLTALSYAELSSMFPSAAAEYEFARRAFNEFAGFIAGWSMLVAYVIAGAAVSIGFGHYLEHFVSVDYRAASAGLLVVLTGVVISGIQRSIWLSVALVVLQVGGLVLVIIAGAPAIGERDLLEGGSIAGVLGGAALVFFAFIGFDDIVTLSDETKEPEKTMPRALLLTLGISALLYVVVGVAAVSLVGAGALASSDRPLALVASHQWGSAAADVIAFIAVAATTNTTLLILTAASRIIYGMAQRGSLPPWAARVGSTGRSPYVASLLVLATALAFAQLGQIEVIASATDLAVFVVFLLVNVSLIALRLKLPAEPRTFRIPGSIQQVPLPPFLAIVTVILLMAYSRIEAWLITLAGLAIGAVVYWLHVHVRRSRFGRGSRASEG
jgi:APA family basic amino acid/polyamine antiporter